MTQPAPAPRNSTASPPTTARIAAFAARQKGLIHTRQLLALGVARSTISRWVGQGRLHRVCPSVYAVGHPVLPALGGELAAVMSASSWDHERLALTGSAVGYQSAAAQLRLTRPWSGQLHVVTTRGVVLPGVMVHRVRALDDADIVVLDGLPITTWSRTLLDLAEVLELRWLIRALEHAVIHGHYDHLELERTLRRNAGRHGARAVRAALAAGHHLTPQITRSVLEDLFLFLVREATPPVLLPEMNGHVVLRQGEEFEVDALWRRLRIAIELDSRYHDPAGPRMRDRARDEALERDGYLTYRFRWADVVGRPAWVLRVVRALIARAQSRGGALVSR